MSDGSGQRKRNHEKLHAKRKNNDEFALSVAKIAVSQVCESTGFQAFQQSALETFSDVAVRYIQSVGRAARSYANSSGREESDAFDIIQSLEDLGFGIGFAGASEVDHCLATSGIIREMIQYVGDCSDVPFAYSLPRFPVVKDSQGAPSFQQKGEEPPSDYIPTWLPAFPEPETYVQLTTVDDEKPVSESEMVEPVAQLKKSQLHVLNVQPQVACNGFEAVPSSVNGRGSTKSSEEAMKNPYLASPLHFGEKQVSPVVLPSKLPVNGRDSTKSSEEAMKNPYLASPLHFGEKQVSPVVLPTKLPVGIDGKIPAMEKHVGKHVSVMEAFAPAIEAVKTGLHDLDDRQKFFISQRPAVHFKIGSGKKSFGSSLDISSQQKDLQRITSWFENDKDKDEKKRKAETILKESMGNSQELAQL